MDIWPKRGELNSPKILTKNATREDEIFCTLRAKKNQMFHEFSYIDELSIKNHDF